MSGRVGGSPAAAEIDSLFPRSSSNRSLNERFSQVLLEQVLVSPRDVIFDPILQSSVPGSLSPVDGGGGGGVRQRVQQCRNSSRRSVWTRLGWRRKTPRRYAAGFWSFRKKYRWRARCSATYRKWRQRRLQSAEPCSVREHGRRDGVPSREQLDAELDDYMSLSKTHLDRQLDDYMAMAGQLTPQSLWD